MSACGGVTVLLSELLVVGPSGSSTEKTEAVLVMASEPVTVALMVNVAWPSTGMVPTFQWPETAS